MSSPLFWNKHVTLTQCGSILRHLVHRHAYLPKEYVTSSYVHINRINMIWFWNKLTYVYCLAMSLGSRRPSLASVHSSGSSVRSYSARRFEKEREQKEEREMQIRLARMHSMTNNKPPTPSPQSTDELLPSVHRQVNIHLL